MIMIRKGKLLECGADPNKRDLIGNNAFQCLLTGHGASWIGQDHEKVIKIIKKMLGKGLLLRLNNSQYEKFYKPYTHKDEYFRKLSSQIIID